MTDRKTIALLLNKIIAFVHLPGFLGYLFIINFGVYAIPGYFVYTDGYPVSETIKGAVGMGTLIWCALIPFAMFLVQ